jgi:hypothetical protein
LRDTLTFLRNRRRDSSFAPLHSAAAQTGSDGLVVVPDGTKYVSSVQHGGVSGIPPGKAAELIAQNIPSAASMRYDEGRSSW